jgi:hypothetical protein
MARFKIISPHERRGRRPAGTATYSFAYGPTRRDLRNVVTGSGNEALTQIQDFSADDQHSAFTSRLISCLLSALQGMEFRFDWGRVHTCSCS